MTPPYTVSVDAAHQDVGEVTCAFWLERRCLRCWLLGLPATSSAQGLGTIAGVVKDASGVVLPGVSVEVASPALIEKTRTAVTDGSGQYAIISLPVGTYSVTFTLPGFSAVKREGIDMLANFTAPINAELKVGDDRRDRHGDRRVAAHRRAGHDHQSRA